MAAATAPTMVCFLDVDPSFQVAKNAIRELEDNERLRRVCTVEVKNSKLRSAGGNEMFGGPNGFSRTLGSTLRAFMSRSTDMDDLHDPNFDGKTHNLDPAEAGAGYSHDTPPPGVQPLVNKKVQAQEISANFDRLYPHFLIENKLEAAGAGTNVDIPGRMVIVELRGGRIAKLHEINVTAKAKCIGPDPADTNLKQYECLNPNVVRITSSPEEKKEDDFPHFKLLKYILNILKMPDEDINPLVDKLQKIRIKEDLKSNEETSGMSTETELRQQAPNNK